MLAKSALYPYKITLLSNYDKQAAKDAKALYPYKITLLSNINVHLTVSEKALHQYKITPLSNTAHFLNTLYRFVSLQNYTTLKRRE